MEFDSMICPNPNCRNYLLFEVTKEGKFICSVCGEECIDESGLDNFTNEGCPNGDQIWSS